jgi:hypothetical protein
MTGPETMKSTSPMHRVEALGLGTGQLLHLGGNDLQSGLLETGQDLADDVLGDGIRLDDGKGAFNGHCNSRC